MSRRRSKHLQAKRREAQERGDKYRRLSIVYSLGAASIAPLDDTLAKKPFPKKPKDERKAERKARHAALRSARKDEQQQRAKSRRKRGKEYSRKYLQYIQSDAWFKFRAAIFAERGRKCEQCTRTDSEMHLHHLTCKNLGCEKPSDVKILCVTCHEQIHGKLTVATMGARGN